VKRTVAPPPNFRKSSNGTLAPCVPPEVHAEIAAAAKASGKSINQWAADVFVKAVHQG
jgi:predicted HicB family RNase H-like nuclease